jgi:hypothetical protein
MTLMPRLRSVALASVLALAGSLTVFTPSASAADVWIKVFTGYYQNWNSGKCLDRGSSTSYTIQYTCNDSEAQTWEVFENQDNNYRFQNIQTQKCLNATSNNPNAQISQVTCADSSSQKWVVTRAPQGSASTVNIRRAGYFLCLAIAGASEANSAHVVQVNCDYSSENERWSEFT